MIDHALSVINCIKSIYIEKEIDIKVNFSKLEENNLFVRSDLNSF